MLQRVGFTVQGGEIEGILHLPDGATAGGAAVLGGRNGKGEHGAYLCDALAAAGIAALRFDHRAEDPASRLADAGGAIRLLRAHPAIPQLTAVVGHSYGAAIAALAAGRDSRLRADGPPCAAGGPAVLRHGETGRRAVADPRPGPHRERRGGHHRRPR